jgi:two-component system, chemotaxis family, sensor kinase CheA
MKNEQSKNTKYQIAANISSVAMVVLLSAVFIFEAWQTGREYSRGLVGASMLLALIIIVTTIKSTKDFSSLAFFIPFIVFVFYTVLMMIGGWFSSQYFLVCFAICGISCIYSNFNRTIGFIIVQNIAVLALVLTGNPVAGQGVSIVMILINWMVYLFGSIILLTLTRSATIVLDKALMQQNSFMNLLASTENYVAIIDEHNKVLYASKTLSRLGMAEESSFVRGRPFIDLFPGRSLKIYAGKMLEQKTDYAEDWEFSLNGQKRYFKAASHSLPGGHNSGTLINLYDMTHLAERDEIAVMKDSMKIGLFFMDKNNIIQDHYSRYLEEMLSETDLFGKVFTDVIADSVTPNELQNIKDYFDMVINHSFDQEMLDDINPLNELHYFNKKNGIKKVFQCGFATVERGRGEVFILVTVYDITLKVELQKKLQEEQNKRQEEMQSVFELIQVDPSVFDDFIKDMEYEFDAIDKILKDKKMSTHETLVKTYQSIHAIKSNAVILGLNVFGSKAHNLESVIKKLREQEEEVPFNEMLNLTMEIERLSNERESFKMVIEKIKSYTGNAGVGGRKQNVNVMIESLAKTVDKAAADMGRKIRFINEVDPAAIERGPRREMKEILMQLIRNSVAHGIETPQERVAKGKNETGIIKLTIKLVNNIINIGLRDDGRGLDYKKIAEKAIQNKIIKKEDAANKNMLIKAIFAPGFSTAENEGMHAGRGIGLNLVRDRIKEVNGAIKLQSEPNKGTLFLITIPIERRKPRNPQ